MSAKPVPKSLNSFANTDSSLENSGVSNVTAHRNSPILHSQDGHLEKCKKTRCKRFFSENFIVFSTVIGVMVGGVLGLSLRYRWSSDEYRKLFYLEFPGRILMNMIMMLILPLTVSSLVTGMTNIGTLHTKSLGTAAIVYYTTTTLLATIIGITLVIVARPGADSKKTKTNSGRSSNVHLVDSLLDILIQCFPENLVSACFQKVSTKYVKVYSVKWNETSNTTYTVEVEKPEFQAQPGTNVLGIVVVSIALGSVINYIGEDGKPLKALFESLYTVTMVLMNVIIWYLPVGIMCLVASQIISAENIWGIIVAMGKFMGVVTAGLAIHGFLALPTVYFVCTRKNPSILAGNTIKALCTAFSTSSSSATLPVTMDCLINKCGISIDVVRFIVPVGATINMDGTALYEAVACIYVAQVNNWDLSLGEIIIVSLMSTAGAVGAAGIPQAGLGTLVIVLSAVGLPLEDAVILLSVDWIMDRLRTAVNVWGDCIGAGIIDHMFRSTIAQGSVSRSLDPGDEWKLTFETPDASFTTGINNPSDSGKQVTKHGSAVDKVTVITGTIQQVH